MRLRTLYLLLAAEGGVRDLPYLVPEKDMLLGIRPSLLAHSSWARLLLLGEQMAELSERSEEASVFVRWNRGSVFFNISAADMRELVSQRLPFFSSRALKLSLLVLLLRTLLWIDPACLRVDKVGEAPVGVTGGDGEWLRVRSSSESLRPRTFLLDLSLKHNKKRGPNKKWNFLLPLIKHSLEGWQWMS